MPCPGAGANAESEPTTGNRFSNIPSGRNKRRRNSCARSCSSARPQRNVPKKPEPVNAPLHHKADQFDQHGMASLFHKERTPSPDKVRSLPPDMRQLIVDLKAEHPGFRPHEIATICFLRFGRRPSPHTVQRVLADGPKPSITMRRYPPYAQISDPYQRRRAIVDLHAQGWSITTISAYLGLCRHFPPPFIVSRY
jgi:hypothetical protein